jgi:hypothetical protein
MKLAAAGILHWSTRERRRSTTRIVDVGTRELRFGECASRACPLHAYEVVPGGGLKRMSEHHPGHCWYRWNPPHDDDSHSLVGSRLLGGMEPPPGPPTPSPAVQWLVIGSARGRRDAVLL